MTKTELMKYTRHILGGVKPTHKTMLTKNAGLLHYDSTKNVDILISYTSAVAIYSRSTATLYVFDYYSQTTVKHIYKAAKVLDAMRITWLYRRSDGIIELALSPHANTFKCTKREHSLIEANDYISYIENNFKR